MDLSSLFCVLLAISIAKGTQWNSPRKTWFSRRPTLQPEKTSSHSSPIPSTIISVSASNPKLTEQNAPPFPKLSHDSPSVKSTKLPLTSSFLEQSETTKPELSPTQPTKQQSGEQPKASTTEPNHKASKPMLAVKSEKQSKGSTKLTSSKTVQTKESHTKPYIVTHAEPYSHDPAIDYSDMYLKPLNVDYHSRKCETLSYPSSEPSTKRNVDTFSKQSKAKTKVPPVELSKAKPHRQLNKLYVSPLASTGSHGKRSLIIEASAEQGIGSETSSATASTSFAGKSKESTTLSPAYTATATTAESTTEKNTLSLVATSAIQPPPRKRAIPTYKLQTARDTL